MLLLTSCSDKRWFSSFDLNEKTFDSGAMEHIEGVSALELHEKSKGIAFHYTPPIDPRFIAKIEIPQESVTSIEKQLRFFVKNNYDPNKIKTNRDWWPNKFKNVVASNVYYNKGSGTLLVYLVNEGEKYILYIRHETA